MKIESEQEMLDFGVKVAQELGERGVNVVELIGEVGGGEDDTDARAREGSSSERAGDESEFYDFEIVCDGGWAGAHAL